MSHHINNISDHVITTLLSQIRITRIDGADTVVLPPFGNFSSPLPFTAVCCLLPYENIPYHGCDVQIDDQLYHTASGDCLIFPEGCRRHFFRSDAGHRSIWVHLRIRLDSDLPLPDIFDLPRVIRGEAAGRCRILMDKLNRQAGSILCGEKIRHTVKRNSDGLYDQLEDQAWMALLLKEILTLSTPKASLQPAVADFGDISDAVRWINKHKFEKITLDDMAHSCHFSRSSFEKKFRRIFGISPGKYLLDLRLTETENMLRSTDASCAQIAEAAGFANQFAFSRLFKKHYGLSPREYRSKKIVS